MVKSYLERMKETQKTIAGFDKNIGSAMENVTRVAQKTPYLIHPLLKKGLKKVLDRAKKSIR